MKKKILIIAAAACILGLSGTAVLVTATKKEAPVELEEIGEKSGYDVPDPDSYAEETDSVTTEQTAEDTEKESTAAPVPQTSGITASGPAATEAPAQPAAAQTPATAEASIPQPAAPQTPAWYEPGTTLPAEAPAQQPAAPQTPSAPAMAEAPAQQPAAPQTPGTPATTEAAHTPVWHEPVYEQVWVVDREAGWYEYPIYEMVYCQQCYGCGGYMYGQAEVDAHTCHAGWHSASYSVQTGTGSCYCDEEGHYETVLVSEGYWE